MQFQTVERMRVDTLWQTENFGRWFYVITLAASVTRQKTRPGHVDSASCWVFPVMCCMLLHSVAVCCSLLRSVAGVLQITVDPDWRGIQPWCLLSDSLFVTNTHSPWSSALSRICRCCCINTLNTMVKKALWLQCIVMTNQDLKCVSSRTKSLLEC